MRKITKIVFGSLASFQMMLSRVYASAQPVPTPVGWDTLGDLINKTSGLIPPLAVVGFIACVIYAGWTRMTALGDPEKEAKSQKIAIAAAVGFLIIALAPVLVKILTNILDVDPGIN